LSTSTVTSEVLGERMTSGRSWRLRQASARYSTPAPSIHRRASRTQVLEHGGSTVRLSDPDRFA
jgi:hypothetical protein